MDKTKITSDYTDLTNENENENQHNIGLEMDRVDGDSVYEGRKCDGNQGEHQYEELRHPTPDDKVCTLSAAKLAQLKLLICALIVTNIIAIAALVISISSIPKTADGNWSQWTVWSTCDVMCGNGSQTRSRTCSNPAQVGNGQHCEGSWIDRKPCRLISCTGDGDWSPWSRWSSCDVTCGYGSQTRIRANSGQNWTDSSIETKSCRMTSCSVDGSWAQWSEWSTCDVTCARGSQTRLRTCTNPVPAGSGQRCNGSVFENKPCQLSSCTVDGGWSEWSTWSGCGITCGNGSQMRVRTCTNPPPAGNGTICTGDWNQMRTCQQSACPSTRNNKDHGSMVAFTAYGNNAVNSSIAFPNVIMNFGDSYDNSTGTFTCNLPGIYYFAVHVGKTLYSFVTSISCSIYLNSELQLSATEFPYPNDINNRNGLALSLSGAFYLSENDTVSVRCRGVNSGGRSCSFTGFLVSSDNSDNNQ